MARGARASRRRREERLRDVPQAPAPHARDPPASRATASSSRSCGPAFNAVLRSRWRWFVTTLINLRCAAARTSAWPRRRLQPGEDEDVQTMIDEMRRHLVRDFPRGGFERAGNTKTHGLVRGELVIHDSLPDNLPARIVRDAEDLSLLGALFGSGTAYRAGHRRRRICQHQRQGDGRSEARSCGTTRSTRRTSPPSARRPSSRPTSRPTRGCNTGAGAICRCSISSISAQTHLLDMLMQGSVERDPDQSARRHFLQLRALPYRPGSGDAIQLLAETKVYRRGSRGCRSAVAGQLPARQHGADARRDGCRIRDAHPAADRPVPDADREQRGAVAGAAVAARPGGDAANSDAEVRLPGAVRLYP